MPLLYFDLIVALMLIWLKLTEQIRWPWVGVLAPLWVPVAAIIALIFITTHR